ncbi:MAG: amidase [Defluviicoccus sp.]|nr:amidase [Defluviicoccus sp.]
MTQGAAEAARAIADGRTTSEAVVGTCLARIAEREETVRAWAFLDPDLALAQARIRDAAPKPLGPLHGVPVGIKDIFDTADMPTEMGSPIYAGHRPAADAAAVAILRAAGAVILGKTVTAEFAGTHPGATANPHDAARTPGGSSQGSAAGVADGMVPVALGTQTGGSVLRPSSYCGIVGFKPTFGTFNRAGIKFAAEGLDTIGLHARNLEDTALVRDVLTGRTPGGIAPLPGPPRIGICRTHLWHLAEPETVAAVEDATEAIREAGGAVEEVALPAAFEALTDARRAINDYERARAMAHEWRTDRERLSPAMRNTVASGLAVPYADYRAALALTEDCRRLLDGLFGDRDALLAPVVNGEAPLGLDYAGDPAFQALWTMLHVPAIALPTHRGPNGMPVGIQLVARRGADDLLLSVAEWVWARCGA